MRFAALAGMPPLIFLAGACAGAPEEMDRPNEQAISSRVSRGSAGELVVAVTHSGGGAGDTVHRLLACPSSAGSCELLASVDTNDRPPPALIPEGSKIAFVINQSDYLGGFRNYSRSLPDLQPGSILIRYRSAPSPPG
jgi:hypothetical protein